MKIEELTWSVINDPSGTTTSPEIIRAVAFAARLGYGDTTCTRFLIALVQSETLKDTSAWPDVLRKVRDLQIKVELAALESGRVVTGEIE
jgi:hypothetical protein